MANNAPTHDYYKQLKESVTFNMSLSSKELFHSNFLAWLADVNRDAFKGLMKELGANTGIWENSWVVKREYKNFDFCVLSVDPYGPTNTVQNDSDSEPENTSGNAPTVLLVLENKVKSIPYKAQLDKYVDKLSQNKKETCDLILLSLAEKFPDRDIIEQTGQAEPKWIIVSYKNYAEALEKHFKPQLAKGDLKYQLIQDYIGFIKNLDILSTQWLPSNFGDSPFLYFDIATDPKQKPTRSYHQDYVNAKQLRIHDLYHKLRFSAICSSLIPELKKITVNVTTSRIDGYIEPNKQQPNNLQKPPIVYAGIEFLHGEPLIELHVFIPGKSFLYVIQVQGSWYQHGIISKKNASYVWSELLKKSQGYEIEDNWINIQMADIRDKKGNETGRDEGNDCYVMKNNIDNGNQKLGADLLPLPHKIIRRNGNQYSGYHKYDMKEGSYVYQAREILTGIKISDIIALMVKDCQSLLSQNP